MLGMLLGPLEERNRVVTLAGLEILGELRVFFVGKEPEVQRSPPCLQVPVGVNRVLCVVVCSILSTKRGNCLDSNRY